MRKILIFSTLLLASLFDNSIAFGDGDTTVCNPSTSECVRVDTYNSAGKIIATSIYYGTKVEKKKPAEV